MSEKTDISSKTLDSSFQTIELRLRQKPEMDTPETETSADELKLRSVDERN